MSVVGILEQMAVLRDISPELHKRVRALNVHLAACFEIDHRWLVEMVTSMPLQPPCLSSPWVTGAIPICRGVATVLPLEAGNLSRDLPHPVHYVAS